MNHLRLSYTKRINEAVSANEYCGDFISIISSSDFTSTHVDPEYPKVKQTLSTITEIYENYFAMYI